MTGVATATCGSLASTSAIFAGTGAPATPLIKLVLGGRTIRSAPMPLGLFSAIRNLSDKDADDGQNHDHLHRNGKNADQSAQRTVKEIAENKLVHSKSWEKLTYEEPDGHSRFGKSENLSKFECNKAESCR